MLKTTRLFSSRWHWLAAVLIGLPLLVLAFVLIFLAWAETPTGSRRLLGLVQEQLELRAQTQMSFEEGQIRPLSGLYFRDLHIQRASPDGAIDVIIPELTLRYALHLFSRRLVIDEFTLRGARIKMILHPGPKPPEEKKPPQAPFDLEKFVREPPVSIEARRLEVTDLYVDFASETAQARQVFKLQKFNLQTGFEFIKERIASQGEIAKGAAFSLEALQKSDEGASTRLGLAGDISGRWALDLRRDGAEWVYEINPSQFAFTVKDVGFVSEAVAGKTSVRLKSLEGVTEIELVARTRELLKASREAIKTDQIHSEFDLGPLEVTKLAEKAPAMNLAIEAQTLQLNSALKEDVALDSIYEIRRLSLPQALAEPVNLKLESKATIARSLNRARFEAGVAVQSEKLLDVKGEAEGAAEEDKTLRGEARITLLAQRVLSALKPAQAAQLKKLVPFNATAQFSANAKKDGAVAGDITLKMPKLLIPGTPQSWATEIVAKAERSANAEDPIGLTAGVDVENTAFGRWLIQAREKITATEKLKGAEGEIEVSQKRRGDPARLPLILERPLVVNHSARLKGAQAELDLKLAAADLAIANKLRIKDVKFSCKAETPDLEKKARADLIMNSSGGTIEVDPRLGKTPLPLTGFDFSMVASLREMTQLALEKFRFNLNGKTIEVTADGSANSKTQDGQLALPTQIAFPDSGLEVAGQTVKGRIDIPLNLTLYRGREVNIEGAAKLSNFAWSKAQMAASGINGSVPFAEKLDWDGKNIHFSRLINQNPFERVAFERIRPLLASAEQLRVSKIQWEDRTYGPFIGFFSVEQNMLSAHQFDLDLGPGRVHGEMFFDAYPANLQLGMLARFTGLDMNQILPERFLKRLQPGEKVIGGRSGFVLNINRGVLDGRVDVTDMGADQLNALINVLDPGYEDSKMNKLRSLLKVGYPTSVSLVFRDGFMDMDIDLMILRVGQKQSLREIPLSSFISGPTSEIVKTTEKGPLKQ